MFVSLPEQRLVLKGCHSLYQAPTNDADGCLPWGLIFRFLLTDVLFQVIEGIHFSLSFPWQQRDDLCDVLVFNTFHIKFHQIDGVMKIHQDLYW